MLIIGTSSSHVIKIVFKFESQFSVKWIFVVLKCEVKYLNHSIAMSSRDSLIVSFKDMHHLSSIRSFLIHL